MVTVYESPDDETDLCVELDDEEQTILESAAEAENMSFEDYILHVIDTQLRAAIARRKQEDAACSTP